MAELTKLPYKELLARIGNTPLVEIQRIFHSEKIRIFAKLEWFNPGGLGQGSSRLQYDPQSSKKGH